MAPAQVRVPRPVSLGIVNDFAVITSGLAALLAPYPERVTVHQFANTVPEPGSVDVVLFDPFGHRHRDGRLLELLTVTGVKVIVYSWAERAEQVQSVLERGAAGFLPKTANGAQILAAVEAVHAGRPLRPMPLTGSPRSASWPGQDYGLTARESEILVLITDGLSNQLIAETIYLSVNSVKTYIRTAYRKMGVSTRPQAILWAIDRGLRAPAWSARDR